MHAAAPTKRRWRLLLAGDVMLGRGIDQALAHPSSPELHEPWVRDAREYVRLAERANGPIPAPLAPEYVWGEALARLDDLAPSLRIVNLETSITDCDRPYPGKAIHYRMHPANVDCLLALRPDCCVLANNHVLDWGEDGLRQTLATLARAGVHTAGAGLDENQALAPAVLDVPGGRVLVFACATGDSGVPQEQAARPARAGVSRLPDCSTEAAERLCRRVEALRREDDLVVASIHWGDNWVREVPGKQRAFAQRLLDSGSIDVIHGHSSHHPLPVQIHRGKLVLHGCGDLVNDYEGIGPHGALRSDLGCLHLADFDIATRHCVELRIVPLQLRRFRLGAPDDAALAWLASAIADPPEETFARLALDQGTLHWQALA
ncbi:MAG TPA: CapA family protein [Zeimonas sp.]